MTAEFLGISIRTVRNKINEYAIDPDQYLPPGAPKNRKSNRKRKEGYYEMLRRYPNE
jgi:hypothetical protein